VALNNYLLRLKKPNASAYHPQAAMPPATLSTDFAFSGHQLS
jgi:hypothetical protein